MIDSGVIAQICATLNPLVSKAKMKAHVGLPVWDNTGSLTGVSIECDKKMGDADCKAEATFTLSEAEWNNPERIKVKAELAIKAINSTVLVTIRHKKQDKKVA